MAIRTLTTASEVIDALGGTFRVAKRFDLSPQAVSNWRSRGIPKAYQIVATVKTALAEKQLQAATTIWRGVARARSPARRKLRSKRDRAA